MATTKQGCRHLLFGGLPQFRLVLLLQLGAWDAEVLFPVLLTDGASRSTASGVQTLQGDGHHQYYLRQKNLIF